MEENRRVQFGEKMASSGLGSLGLSGPNARCMCAHMRLGTHECLTFQAHTSDKCVLSEEWEDPLIVPPPENSRKGLEGFIEVEER